jgi:putative acyl-CoA dehydrogenase
MSLPRSPCAPDASADTDGVFNQTPPLEDFNAFDCDAALKQGVARAGAGWALAQLREYGARTGSAEVTRWGFEANAFAPRLVSHDRNGRRIDLVEYHESYHRLMSMALTAGMHSAPWVAPRTGAHVARAALVYLQAQVDAGHGCPLTMTFAAVPTLKLAPELADVWLPRVLADAYDPRNVPYTQKAALTIGMGMTERQGGSDVRANTTRAIPFGTDGNAEAYELVGHKWFTSAPMCDAFLMLAQAPGGLTCFLVPRWRPDGRKNGIELNRLKPKMGNVSNASSEIDLVHAFAWRVGDEGRGVRTIIEMVAMTRFDCMLGSAASQRQGVAQALHHATHRKAFGTALIRQPLMRNVLADLQLEVEGSLALALRMAQALDSPEDENERRLLRIGLPVGKYWICKRSPMHAYESMECLGAMASSRSSSRPVSTAMRRSTRSGKAPATSRRSMCCARSRRRPTCSPRGWRSSIAGLARTQCSTPRSAASRASSGQWTKPNIAPATWPISLRSPCRRVCSCERGLRRLRVPSLRPASAPSTIGITARCLAGWTSMPSSRAEIRGLNGSGGQPAR